MTTTIDLTGSGAVLEGTTRADAPTLKPYGWRWSRNLGAWFLPRTLRPETVAAKVAATVAALGRPVEIIGADDQDDDDARAERRHQRDRELIGQHEARAARLGAEATERFDKARALGDMIPFGQPILVGHHSERRHRRHIEKIGQNMDKGVQAYRDSETEERLARSAAHRVARTEAKKAGPKFGPDDVNPGDLIGTPWGPMLALRVNAKSVTVPSLIAAGTECHYTDTVAWSKVRSVTAGNDESRAQAATDLATVKAHRATFDQRRADQRNAR